MEVFASLEGDLDLIQLNRELVNCGNCMNQVSIHADDANVILSNCMKIDDVRSTMSYSGFEFMIWWNKSDP